MFTVPIDPSRNNQPLNTSEPAEIEFDSCMLFSSKTPKPVKTVGATKRVKPNKNLKDPYAQMRAALKAMGQTDTQIEAMIAASKANEGK